MCGTVSSCLISRTTHKWKIGLACMCAANDQQSAHPTRRAGELLRGASQQRFEGGQATLSPESRRVAFSQLHFVLPHQLCVCVYVCVSMLRTCAPRPLPPSPRALFPHWPDPLRLLLCYRLPLRIFRPTRNFRRKVSTMTDDDKWFLRLIGLVNCRRQRQRRRLCLLFASETKASARADARMGFCYVTLSLAFALPHTL